MVSLLPKEYMIAHPYDDDDEFELKMNRIMYNDDVSMLHDYLSQGFDDDFHYPTFLDMCLRMGARKCALHIIQGNLPHGPPMITSDHPHILCRVINGMCEPHVFHLLLNNCDAVNQVNKLVMDLFPIHWLLDLLVEIPPLSEWSPGKPLSMLIHSLSLPHLKPKLDSARILAQHTPSLDQVALGYILNGEIIPLAALLLVAPFTNSNFETIKPYADIDSIASLASHGLSVPPAMFSAAALLYIFENNGYKLPSHLENPFFSPMPQKGSAQPAVGDQSVVKRLIPQTDNMSFPRRQFSKSSQMTYKSTADEIRGLSDRDANLSSDHYLLLLHSLLKENEGNTTFQLLQANLSRVDEELPALLSAIRTFCNDDDAMEHFKSRDACHVNLAYMCLLHVVLSSLVKYDYLSKWSVGQSVVKLILLLFLQRELRPALECAQLIAGRINSVNEVARKLIQQGELIQLAGLLLVARKKAMEPFDSGDTIKKATSMENVVSQVLHGESVTATVDAAGLIKIFEKAGDALTEYWSIHNDEHEHEPIGVIVEVAKRIQHSGIQVLCTDVDLTDIYNVRSSHSEVLKSVCERFGIWSSHLEMLKSRCERLGICSSHPKMLRSICKRLGIKIDDTSGLPSQMSRKSPFPSVKSAREKGMPVKVKWTPPTNDRDSEDYKRQIVETSLGARRSQAFDKSGTRPFSTSSCSVGRVSRGALKHSLASPSPTPMVRNLAYLAMKLKRGVRLV